MTNRVTVSPPLSPKRYPITIVANSITKKGGTELYIRSSIIAYKELGIKTFLIITKVVEEDLDFLQKNSCEYLLLKNIADDSKKPSAILAAAKESMIAESYIRKNKSKLVIIHCYSPNFLSLIRLIHKKVKLTLFVHTPTFTCPAGARYLPTSERVCTAKPGLSCFITNVREKCISISFEDHLPASYLFNIIAFKTLMKRYLSNFSIIVGNSNQTTSELMKLYDLKSNIEVIYPPLVPGGDSQKEASIGIEQKNNKNLIFIGRLERFKGCDDALRALALLPNDFHLEVYGDGPMTSDLKKLASELGVKDQVRWCGWVPQEIIFEGLRKSAICLVPSKLFETFGQVGPQAISQRTAVVAYDVGGIRSWCTADIGSLVPVGEWHSLAKQVLHWSEKIENGYQIPLERVEQWRQQRFIIDFEKFTSKYNLV